MDFCVFALFGCYSITSQALVAFACSCVHGVRAYRLGGEEHTRSNHGASFRGFLRPMSQWSFASIKFPR